MLSFPSIRHLCFVSDKTLWLEIDTRNRKIILYSQIWKMYIVFYVLHFS